MSTRQPPSPTLEELLASLNQPLPFSDDAEKGVLSCWLQQPARCEEGPDPAMFYHEGNRVVAATLLSLHAMGRVDPILLTQRLRELELLDKAGGPAAITGLYDFVPLAVHFPHYVGIMREKFQLRQMIGALAAGMAYLQGFTTTPEASLQDALAHVQMLVSDAASNDGTPDIPCRPFRDLLRDVIDQADDFVANGEGIPGLSTGLPEMDQIMGGLEPGCLTVIAAESSDGKSSLGRQLLEAVCADGHHAVDYTYEMQPVTEARRILCSQSRVDSTKLKRGNLDLREQQAVAQKVGRIQDWHMSIVDVAGKTIEQICRDITRRSRRLPPGKKLVTMIDYIQLCKTSGESRSREREVAHITALAKQTAKLTGAHIIMPSQVNKEGEVRESMSIEQDADTLVKINKIEGALPAAPATQPTTPGGRRPFKDRHQRKGQEQQHNQEQNQEQQQDAAPSPPAVPAAGVQQPQPQVRDLFFKKVRDGERFKKVRVHLLPGMFRFEPYLAA